VIFYFSHYAVCTCCVNSMARTVFVMSRTFGGKTKDTNEAVYDHYPLKECKLYNGGFFSAVETSDTNNSHFAIVVFQ
jgi:hypothetical protein